MDEAEARYRGMLKDLPASHGPLLDDLMRDPRAPQYATPPVLYKKVAGGARVGPWVCDQYEGAAAGRKAQDVWTVAWTDLGLTDEEIRVLAAYGEFYRELAGTRAPVFPELTGIERRDLAPALFETPAGYAPVDAYQDLTQGR